MKINDQLINFKVKKECVVRDANGNREAIMFEYPQIIQTKESFCQMHQIKFNDICHRLPSMKARWIGCPICFDKNDKKERIQLANNHLRYQNHSARCENKEAFYNSLPKEESKQIKPPIKTTGFSQDYTKSRG